MKDVDSAFDVIIVGGGASGLMAALSLPPALRILLLEKEATLGKKIPATGNGRCNLSNRDIKPQYYHGQQAWFAEFVLRRYDVRAVLDAFHRLGLLVRAEDGRIYPYSMQAKSVLQALLNGLEHSGVQVRCSTKVSRLHPPVARPSAPPFFDVECEGGERYQATSVIVCTGGAAMPKLGSDGSGYALMERLGHSLIPPQPALVQLTCRDVRKRLSGLRVQARVTIRPPVRMQGLHKQTTSGEVLFTDYGLSGIPILNLSGFAARCLAVEQPVRAELDLLPERSLERLTAYLTERRANFPALKADEWGTGFLPDRLSRTLLNEVRRSKRNAECLMRDLSADQLSKLAARTKAWPFQVSGTKGFDFAQVTSGGLDTGAFDPQTLESVLVPGLFAAGEILDLDGDCGGYNLHWAWASGMAAAEGVKHRYDFT